LESGKVCKIPLFDDGGEGNPFVQSGGRLIEGKRVRLRALDKQDLPFFVKWLNDPQVTEFLTLYQPLSLTQEENWFQHVLSGPSDEIPLGIEALIDGTWHLIGNISFHKVNWVDRSAEVGIFIGNKDCWNKGFGREAMMLMVSHAFDHLNLNRVFLRVLANNLRGIASYNHAGFIEEGRLRQAAFKNGQYVDVMIMSVLRDEWIPGRE
jgi:RimJ/RimL family protein N-acetyltransferase